MKSGSLSWVEFQKWLVKQVNVIMRRERERERLDFPNRLSVRHHEWWGIKKNDSKSNRRDEKLHRLTFLHRNNKNWDWHLTVIILCIQHILDAIGVDTDQQTLESDCTTASIHSYEAGKSIQMVARLASISRAFDTEHYIQLDQSLRRCLDLWLGIVGGIPEDNAIR